MKISGVDLGARKAAVSTFLVKASGEVELVDVTSLFVHPAMRGHELNVLATMVGDITFDNTYVFIEEPLVGRGVKASMTISQTAGAVMAAISNHEVQTELVNVKVWKKQVVGNGNAPKHEVRLWLETTHPAYADRCGDDQDAIDATCIGLFGVRTVNISLGLADARSVPEW